MARLRRKSCIILIGLVLLTFIVTVVLKSFALQDLPFGNSDSLEPFPKNEIQAKKENNAVDRTKITDTAHSENKDAELEATLRKFSPPNYNLHVFYYTWYGSPQFDGKYIHWDHPLLPHWDSKVAQGYPQGRHSPPDDIGASFYPALGAYSSKDPSVIEAHMQQLRTAAIGKSATSHAFFFS